MNEMQLNKEVNYEVDGAKIKLSLAMIKKNLVTGGGQPTDQELIFFLKLCETQKLNPFIKDVYLIKFGANDPAAMVTSKDVYFKRADNHPEYDGIASGVIVVDADGVLVHKEGAVYFKQSETLVGAWCRVFRKDRKDFYHEVLFDEYVGKKKDGTPNSNWANRPSTMITKVAESQCLKKAFPNVFQGLYIEDEMGIQVEGMASQPTTPTVSSERLKDEAQQHANEDAALQKAFEEMNSDDPL